MWVKNDGKIGFLLPTGDASNRKLWDAKRFREEKKTFPAAMVMVRMASGKVERVTLGSLVEDTRR